MSEIQSVLFSKRYWTVDRAKKWLREHKKLYGKMHTTKDHYRFRQTDPKKYKSFATKKVTPSIMFIYGIS